MDEELLNKRAKQIAKDTAMEIIDMEIEDWLKEVNRLSEEIKLLTIEMTTVRDRRLLWLKAKRIKEGIITQ